MSNKISKISEYRCQDKNYIVCLENFEAGKNEEEGLTRCNLMVIQNCNVVCSFITCLIHFYVILTFFSVF